MAVEGIAQHWAVMTPQADHARCVVQGREIGNQHNDSRSLYSDVFCDHGITVIGRGLTVRAGATCNSFWNERYRAMCWIGGPGHRPSSAAFEHAHAIRATLIGHYPGATRLIGHREACSTECPGPDWMAWVHENRIWRPQPSPLPPPERKYPVEGFLMRDTNGIYWHVGGTPGQGYVHKINERLYLWLAQFLPHRENMALDAVNGVSHYYVTGDLP